MPRENIFDDVAKATVTLLGKGGQGVLVSSNLILTAAHCINFSFKGGMVLGDHRFFEKIKTGEGELIVAPLAVEPVSDLACLGSLDEQIAAKEAEDFEKFCEQTSPVPLCRRNYEIRKDFRVHIYTHKGTWVTGSAMQSCEDAKALYVEADEQIEGGTSGGPIINDSGELVGIVSHFSLATEGQHQCWGLTPRPHLALPVWVCRRIFGGSIENDP